MELKKLYESRGKLRTELAAVYDKITDAIERSQRRVIVHKLIDDAK